MTNAARSAKSNLVARVLRKAYRLGGAALAAFLFAQESEVATIVFSAALFALYADWIKRLMILFIVLAIHVEATLLQFTTLRLDHRKPAPRRAFCIPLFPD